LYSNVVVACIYSFDDPAVIEDNQTLLTYCLLSLQECIRKHPFLSVVIQDAATASPKYAQLDSLDLNKHVIITTLDDDAPGAQPEGVVSTETSRITKLMTDLHNETPPDLHRMLTRPEAIPPCKVADVSKLFQPPSFEVLPALPRLPITLSYLLAPALGHYLPRYLANLLGLKAEVSGADEYTWVSGSTFASLDTQHERSTQTLQVGTRMQILQIPATTVKALLQLCRVHSTTMTPLMALVIAQSLAQHLRLHIEDFSKYDNLIAQIPINLRKLAGVSQNTVGLFASTAYLKYTFGTESSCRPSGPSEVDWSLLVDYAKSLKLSASTLTDTPIGLLAWISDVEGWLRGKLGGKRDASFQLSNLGARKVDIQGEP
ncbi:Alcohol acetyltransferase, partial [Elasticomyces elasticus]